MISIRLPALILALIVFDRGLALLSPGDAGAYPFILQRFSEPIGVIAAIPDQPVDFWEAAEQRPCAGVVANLAGRKEQVERTPLAVEGGVQIGIHAAFGPANQTTAPTFLAEMPVAVWCAFRTVASIITVFRSPCSAARPASICAKMPFSL